MRVSKVLRASVVLLACRQGCISLIHLADTLATGWILACKSDCINCKGSIHGGWQCS
jgi:hypothetical protein